MPPFDEQTGNVNVIVETPKCSRVKYSYDPKTGLFILSKAMPAGMMFPFNFGFIPQTLGGDGDPLDMLILNEEPLVTGCLLKVIPIAVIKATQTEEGKAVSNDRIVGQAIMKETPVEFQTLKLTRSMAAQVESFFFTYNKLYGKEFKVLGIAGAKKARHEIKQGAKAFQKNQREDESG